MTRIKIFILLLMSVSVASSVHAQSVSLNQLRGSFEKAAASKEFCASTIENLKRISSQPVYLAYLGAYQTIWAKHAGNPFSQLSTFKEGRKKIDAAVEADPSSVEIRLVRLSVQKNAPGFLGYHHHVRSDESFVKSRIDQVSDASLQKMASKVLNQK